MNHMNPALCTTRIIAVCFSETVSVHTLSTKGRCGRGLFLICSVAVAIENVAVIPQEPINKRYTVEHEIASVYLTSYLRSGPKIKLLRAEPLCICIKGSDCVLPSAGIEVLRWRRRPVSLRSHGSSYFFINSGEYRAEP